MTTEVISQQLTAGVQSTFGQGRIWYFKTGSGPLTVIAERIGTGASIERFINVSPGFKFTAPDGQAWTYLRVTSATTQSIELIIGDNDVEVSNAVTIAGVASVSDSANAVTNMDVIPGAGGAQVLLASNQNRRRAIIGVQNVAGAVAQVTFKAAGNNYGTRTMFVAANGFQEITFNAKYGISVTTAPATVNYYVHEELQ